MQMDAQSVFNALKKSLEKKKIKEKKKNKRKKDLPVVSSTRGTKDKVIRTEKITIGSSLNHINHSGLQINKNRARDITTSVSLSEINIDPLELLSLGPGVVTLGVDGVLRAEGLPEASTNLVSALAGLDADDFPHVGGVCVEKKKKREVARKKKKSKTKKCEGFLLSIYSGLGGHKCPQNPKSSTR